MRNGSSSLHPSRSLVGSLCTQYSVLSTAAPKAPLQVLAFWADIGSLRPAHEREARNTVSAKTYVLDTCVLLADPHSILRFDEHDVVLPLVVVEELDRQKTRMDEVGANARSAIRLLEELGASESGGLADARRLDGGGSLRIELNGIYSGRLPEVLDPATADHRILSTCLNLVDDGEIAVLVTKDAALRYAPLPTSNEKVPRPPRMGGSGFAPMSS